MTSSKFLSGNMLELWGAVNPVPFFGDINMSKALLNRASKITAASTAVEAAEADLASANANLAALLGETPAAKGKGRGRPKGSKNSGSTSSNRGRGSGTNETGMTIPEAISTKVLPTAGDEGLTAGEVHAALAGIGIETSVNTVRQTLSKMESDNAANRVSRGHYGPAPTA